MKVIYGIGRVKGKLPASMLALGVFDGLHCGHQYLIGQMIRRAKALKVKSVVVTFFPHPANVLNPKANLPLLIPLKQRVKLIEALGADICCVVNFTKKFSRLTPRHFIEKYIVGKVNPKEIFVGRNFRFGRNRGGSINFLKTQGRRYGFSVSAVAPLKVGNDVISSSRIRKLILEGRIDKAGRLLGRPASLFGIVHKGDGRGKTLGYPTANIHPFNQIIPARGVYVVQAVLHNKIFLGMANVGTRPSFRKTNTINIEVHIFDFNEIIYGCELRINFIKKFRKEKKFDSLDDLKMQLHEDKITALKILSR